MHPQYLCFDNWIHLFNYFMTDSTVNPPAVTPTVAPSFKQCGWSSWLNTNSPSVSLTSGDFESIYDLKAKYGLCKEIRKIECRVAGSKTPLSLAGQESVACDARNGLRCYNRDQPSGLCYDYEVRVLCWADTCKILSNLDIIDRSMCIYILNIYEETKRLPRIDKTLYSIQFF